MTDAIKNVIFAVAVLLVAIGAYYYSEKKNADGYSSYGAYGSYKIDPMTGMPMQPAPADEQPVAPVQSEYQYDPNAPQDSHTGQVQPGN